jgi:micrococcal nuclease
VRELPYRVVGASAAGLAAVVGLGAAHGQALPPPALPPLPAPAPSPPPPPAPALQRVRPARVISVRNGQELRVLIAGSDLPRRVRLACLQAPRPGQVPWAQTAQRRLRALLPVGSEVSLELRGRDVFNREVALVRRNGRDVALPLLEEGAVFRFDGLPGGCNDLNYRAVEGLARRRGLGIWSVPGGIERPWSWLEREGDPTAEP